MKTPKTQKMKPYEGVSVDGLYGASQFHLRTDKPMTAGQKLMVDYAVRLPGTGFVDVQLLESRIIITTTVEPEYRDRHARLYQKAISSVMKGGWLYEMESQFPKVKTVGLRWMELTADEMYAIEAQYRDGYPFMDNVESWRWWRADAESAVLSQALRESLIELEERRKMWWTRSER